MPSSADLTPQEIASALAARRELGPDYEDAIASALAEKMAKEINARVGAELAAQGLQPSGPMLPTPPAQSKRQPQHQHTGDSSGTAIAVVSLIAGIPVTAITASTSHGSVVAIGVAWLGIAMVNVAHSLGRRRR